MLNIFPFGKLDQQNLCSLDLLLSAHFLCRENIGQLETFFQSYDETLEKLEPISTEPEKLKQQLDEAERLQDEIQEKKRLLRDAQTEGQWMMEHSKEDEDMVISIVTILSSCQAKLDRLSAKIDYRHSRLQSAVVDSQNVEVTFAEFIDDLNRIEEQIAGMRPISVVKDTLKEQERQFEVFRFAAALELRSHATQGYSENDTIFKIR